MSRNILYLRAVFITFQPRSHWGGDLAEASTDAQETITPDANTSLKTLVFSSTPNWTCAFSLQPSTQSQLVFFEFPIFLQVFLYLLVQHFRFYLNFSKPPVTF